MKTRRLATAGLAMLASLSFAVAGCDAIRDATNGTPEDPKLALASSAAALSESTFRMDVTLGGMTMTGTADPSAQALHMSTSTPDTEGAAFETIVIGQDAWVKVDLSALTGEPATWMHVDMTTLPEDNTLGLRTGQYDMANAANLFQAVNEVEQVDERTYRGSVDLTRVNDSSLADEDTLAQLGEDARSLPFTATLDDQGRLTKLVMTMPESASEIGGEIVIEYSDFGVPVTISAPDPSEVTEGGDLLSGLIGD